MYLAQIVFNLLLFVLWPFHFIYNAFLINQRKKTARELKLLLSQVDQHWRWDRDVLSEPDSNRLHQIKAKAQELSTSKPDVAKTQTFIKESLQVLQRTKSNRLGFVKESLELLVVVFGVVMGARALFLQPFKIPTGSMQPTLFGINFFESKEAVDVSVFKRIFDYVNYSKRYVNVVVQEDGYLSNTTGRRQSGIVKKNPFIFFPYTSLRIGNRTYNLPGDPDTVLKYIKLQNRPHIIDSQGFQKIYFKKGEVLAQGYLQLGDHLFVDRVRFNFTEPRPGDITVFVTDGIKDIRGSPLRGRFFIKRLVGLPGDELKIVDRKLYVRENGGHSFTLVDGSFHPGFDRIYSNEGGYKGYSQPQHPLCQYLRSENDTFQLKDDEYFMLGDNSENSQDSRFWGIVPRRNIVGRANFVYWPFSPRWAFADAVELK